MTKYLLSLFAAAFVLLFFACADQDSSPEINRDSILQDSLYKDSLKRDSLRTDSIARIPPKLPDSSFIPKGYVIMDMVYGDLNLDTCTDAIVVLQHESEIHGATYSEKPRPVIIFLGDSTSTLRLELRNDNMTYHEVDGQMFGEPYNGIEIDSGTFTVRHYGGSRFRWTRDYVFQYDSDRGTWFYTKNYVSMGDMLGEMNELDSLGQCIPYERDTLILKRKVDIRKFDIGEAETAELE